MLSLYVQYTRPNLMDKYSRCDNWLICFQHSLNYQQYFLQPMLQYVCDKQPELRQASAYGIGVMAQFGGEGYAQACSGINLRVKN